MDIVVLNCLTILAFNKFHIRKLFGGNGSIFLTWVNAVVCVSKTTLYHTQNYKNAYLEFANYLLLV
jgi:hypothetical protein